MENYSEYSDARLVSLLKEGDEAAFSTIYQRYWPLLYRHARRFLKHDDEVRDVIQEVFLLLWDKCAILEISTSLSAYLFASVRNRSLNYIAHSKVKTQYIHEFAVYAGKGISITDLALREREMARIIEQEVAALPPKMGEAFRLSQQGNLSYKEIAEQMGSAENTIRKQISQARERLRTRLGPYLGVIMLFF